jgi:hypothetical protein
VSTFEIPESALEWLRHGERGISSENIFSHLTGVPIGDHSTWRWGPSDPADLRRCRLLLEAVPEFKARFAEMATLSPHWAELVDRWDVLCFAMDGEVRRLGDRAPQTFETMKLIFEEARRAPGW